VFYKKIISGFDIFILI